MLIFDPVELAWSDVSERTSGVAPSPRSDFGFALAGNKLYVHGGYNPIGNVCYPCLISSCTCSHADVEHFQHVPYLKFKKSKGRATRVGLERGKEGGKDKLIKWDLVENCRAQDEI
jgi:hypothetical protein